MSDNTTQAERGTCPSCGKFYVTVLIRKGKRRCPRCGKELPKK